MQHFFRVPGRESRNAHSHVMKELFGLRPQQPWPAEGMKPRVIQGILTWVAPLSAEPDVGRRRCRHRVMARCPDCAMVLSAGRMHQHLCSRSTKLQLSREVRREAK